MGVDVTDLSGGAVVLQTADPVSRLHVCPAGGGARNGNATGRWFDGRVALLGCFALCGCSLVLDPSDLGRGGSDASDATTQVAATDSGVDSTKDGEAEAENPGTSGLDAEAETPTFTGADATSDGVDDTANVVAAVDAGIDAPSSETGVDAARDTGNDALAVSDGAGLDAADEGGSLAVGLFAYYPFDETGGGTCADASGNGRNATMRGATFTKGLRGNAATLSGANQYVSLVNGIVSSLTDFSISVWFYSNSSVLHTHIFDFGTGTTTYMFLTPGPPQLQFAITTAGVNSEQRLNGTTRPIGTWQHVAVTLTGVLGTLYVNGAQVAQNTAVARSPASLGGTSQNWLGRSQDPADPYLNGQIDEFRIYDRALSAAEVQKLFLQR